MKNKGKVIALISLLIMVVLFLIAFLVYYLNSGTDFRRGIIKIGSKNSNVIIDKTFELEDIKNIEINQDAGDVIFRESQNDNIEIIIYGENEDDVNVNLKEGELIIDYTNSSKFIFLNFGTVMKDIIIYIPSTYLNNIKINSDYGRCEVANLENASVNINCNAGDIELGKIKNAIIKCDYGNINIKEILNKCDIKADCGNIEIEKIFVQENSSIKANMGDVSINEINDIYIDADVDLGNKSIRENNKNSDVTLEIKCDLGNITVK